jgi:hypothetical protein
MEIIHRSPWNLTCLVFPVPSTYLGMPSPALGPAVLCLGDDVASLPPQDLTQQSGLNTHLASDLCRAHQRYDCMVCFLMAYITLDVALASLAVPPTIACAMMVATAVQMTVPWHHWRSIPRSHNDGGNGGADDGALASSAVRCLLAR